MLLSIIIVNYNTGALVKSCLESLLLHSLPKRTEIIVVDNASHDESATLLKADFPEITMIANTRNQGLAAGVNAGIARGRGQFYLILNPDILVLPAAIEQLINFMKDHPRVGIAGAQLLSPNDQLQYSCYRYYTLPTIVYRRTFLGKTKRGKKVIDNFLMKDFDHQQTRAVDWLMGACLMVRASAAKEVGGMDEQFFLYFEDVDWCRRFWQKGWQVMYVPQAKFYHFHQRSSEQVTPWAVLTSKAVRHHITSAIKYFWKYRSQPLPMAKA